jgi:Na+-translocating ferredoxin:NAD+ oxidoreductase RNF subunit RnfB
MPLIEIKQEKCKRCYACVRICPVKAIKVESNQEFPIVIDSRCIGCGSCLHSCIPGAISFKSSIEEAKGLLRSGQKVAALVAPSIAAEYPDITDYRKFVEMIRSLGFSYVIEASFGVDIIARKYKQLYDDFHGKYYISANCPAVVAYIEKYHPEIISNIAPLVSPMIATTLVARKKYGDNLKVIYIGPCIASKTEAQQFTGISSVDCVLTYTELRQLFTENNINENSLEFSDFDPPFGYKGSIEPISNGMVQAANIDEQHLSTIIITSEGKNNMQEAVKQFENKGELIKKHFNIYYNEGCMMGPGMSTRGDKYIKQALVTEYANKRIKNFDKLTWEMNMSEFLQLDYSRTFKNDDQRIPIPSEDRIASILKMLGKQNPEDELGCAACGYESCREFAIAVGSGLAKTDMCHTFALRNRQEYIKTLKITNEKLAKTQDALKESEKLARKEQQSASEASETTTAMLQKIPSSIVIVDEQLKIIQANNSFIDILGDDAKEISEIIPGLLGADLKTLLPYNFYNLFAYVLQHNENLVNKDVHFDENLYNVSVFTIKKSKIVGAIIRDMYVPEIRKEEVIKRLGEVIDKNLGMVQQIGFLLGEGASETERMLNSIIEFHKSGKDKK